jgi:membrane protein
LFRLYVGTAAITSFYGAMALLPLFLLWLYLMWLVVLFGLELTYTLQAMKGRRFKHEAHRPDAVTLFDPAWLIPFMGYVAEAFERGKSCSLETLVQKMRLPHRVVTRVVQELIRSQLVHQVQQGEEHAGAITLARPAEQIRTSDVIAAGERLMPSLNVRSAEGSAWSFVRELAERRQASTEQTTLAEALRTGSSQ